MAAVSRREFIKRTATDAAVAGWLAAAGGTMLEANPLGLPIGSQTYPHRQMIRDGDFAGLLATLKAIGVERIELCSPFGYREFASLSDAKQVKKTVHDHGMKCESAHFNLGELRDHQQKSIDWAKEVGMTQMFVATLGAGNNPTMDAVKQAADEYNAIAAIAAKAGIQQGLHNEGFEVSSVDGRRTYDILMERLDPKLVKFQFQMSTINQGFVADEYFTKYPGRFISMHVQDVDLNATPPPPPTGPDGQPARGADGGGRGRGMQTSVGKGSIDWVKTFKAARIGGVRNYFVEQNMELTKASVAALRAMKI